MAWFRCGRGVETITYTEKFDIEYKKISERSRDDIAMPALKVQWKSPPWW